MPGPMPDSRVEALSRWLAPQLGLATVEVGGLSRAGSGNSNETTSFTASWQEGGTRRTERLVVRVQPGADSLFLRPSVAQEAAVLRSVATAGGVPVPAVLGVEEDASVLGAPFFVMRHVDGRVLPDVPTYHKRGWLVDLSPAERARHWDEGLQALAAIALLPRERFGFLLDGAAEASPVRRLLSATREYFDWAVRGRDVGLLATAMQHLEDGLPGYDDGALSWGDARPGNMLFHEDGRVAAVLDWEMAAIGPAEVDLGWWLFMEDFYSVRARASRLEGVPDDAAVVARWEELVGRAARDLTWFQVLAGLRMALVMLRSRDQYVDRGVLDDDATTHLYNPATQQLAHLLGEPVPDLSPHFAGLMRNLQQEKSRR